MSRGAPGWLTTYGSPPQRRISGRASPRSPADHHQSPTPNLAPSRQPLRRPPRPGRPARGQRPMSRSATVRFRYCPGIRPRPASPQRSSRFRPCRKRRSTAGAPSATTRHTQTDRSCLPTDSVSKPPQARVLRSIFWISIYLMTMIPFAFEKFLLGPKG